jgi:hypothetical protein
LLVEEEDLAEDLGWDATGGREGVAAGTDRAQGATDGGHFSIDEVEGCRVCKGGGKDVLQDVVDEGNARLDGIGPILGGSGARHVCGRYKSLEPRSSVGLLEGLEHLQYIVLRGWVVHLDFGKKTKRTGNETSLVGYRVNSRHVLLRNTGRVNSGAGSNHVLYTKCASVTSCFASHSKGIVYY